MNFFHFLIFIFPVIWEELILKMGFQWNVCKQTLFKGQTGIWKVINAISFPDFCIPYELSSSYIALLERKWIHSGNWLCDLWTVAQVPLIHGSFKARMQDVVPFSLLQGSSWPRRDQAQVSTYCRQSLHPLSHQGSLLMRKPHFCDCPCHNLLWPFIRDKDHLP